MKLKTLVRQLDNVGLADNLFDAIGLSVRRPIGARAVGGLGMLALGALVGAGIGVLMAPAPGVEMRQRAKNGIDDLRNRLMTMGETIGQRAREMGNEVESRAKSSRGRPSSNI
jgi:hypothetical protein